MPIQGWATAGIYHQVLTAISGSDGVDLANAEQPDIVLMDVVMPGVNGFQATRQITRGEHTSHIPVVIVSSKNQNADRVWGERQGACGYLTKTVDQRILISTVNDVLQDRDHRCTCMILAFSYVFWCEMARGKCRSCTVLHEQAS